MKPLLLLITILFISCSSVSTVKPKEGKSTYSYADVSGKFAFTRETRLVKQKLVTRTQLVDLSSKKVLEKNILVSQIGTIRSDNSRILTVRPMASEFTVWLEGQKHSSVMKLNTKSKAMTVTHDKGTTQIDFPKSVYFCFYSQIPECLYHNHFLQRAQAKEERTLDFYVIWDSFPYTQDQYSGIGRSLFSHATLKFEGELKQVLQFMVELDGQVIFYHFSKSYDLVKIAWVAQGITVVPPGEEISNEDQ